MDSQLLPVKHLRVTTICVWFVYIVCNVIVGKPEVDMQPVSISCRGYGRFSNRSCRNKKKLKVLKSFGETSVLADIRNLTIIHCKQRTSCLSNCLKGFSLGIFIKKGYGIFLGKVKNSNFAVANKN